MFRGSGVGGNACFRREEKDFGRVSSGAIGAYALGWDGDARRRSLHDGRARAVSAIPHGDGQSRRHGDDVSRNCDDGRFDGAPRLRDVVRDDRL